MIASFFVPGRIEVLGKHTDYAGGRSLLCAIDRGIRIDASARDDGRIRITDAALGETVEIGAGSGANPAWRIYPETVVRRAARDFGVPLRGCELTFRSNLPIAAGLSSSTALVTAVFLALDSVTGLRATPAGSQALPDAEALASYLAAVERGSAYPGLGGAAPGAGIRGGGEDHVAVLCGVDGSLVQYSFEPTRREAVVPLPDGWAFAIASSGVRAEKSGAARDRYNRLSDLAARAAEVWRDATGRSEPHLGAILRSTTDVAGPAEPALERLLGVIRAHALADERAALLARVEQFAVESETLVPAAARALAAADLAEFGGIVARSQAGAERLLGNQIPETVFLVRSALEGGAAAASAFGAGFGGAVWALVRSGAAAGFLEYWRQSYAAAFPAHIGDSEFFATSSSPPASANSAEVDEAEQRPWAP